jgi:hypothetical protein
MNGSGLDTVSDRTCARCGTRADAGLIFCKQCGATLRPPASLIQPGELPPATVADVGEPIVMKRPTGVTVMANIFLFMAYCTARGLVTYLSWWLVQRRGLLVVAVANLLITATLGIALLKMQRWSRWVGIAVCAAALVFIPRQVVAAHGLVGNLIRVELWTLFYVWAIWYLFQPHVKAAFRSDSKSQTTLYETFPPFASSRDC